LNAVLHRTSPDERLVAADRALRLDATNFLGTFITGNPKIAIIAYFLAVGFILVVAFHSPSKTLITASAPAPLPVAGLK
jgi:hypothetical protein